MKELLAGFVIVSGVVVGVVGSAFLGFHIYAYFAPKYEGVRRDVMLESRYYSEATIRELYRLKGQYEAARTDAERATIVAAARHEFQIFPDERLPADLRVWMAAIR